MNLVIVESPTKCRTLGRFLGKEYRIEATVGHIRDLPKKKLGVDVEKSFKPTWVIVSGKRKRAAELKKIAKEAKKLYLATDPDREGEAIAWHAMKILGYKDTKILREGKTKRQKDRLISQYPSIPVSVSRIIFHEITKDAVQKALKSPRGLDLALVDAQKARRVLDRLVGYKLSPLLWKKIQRGLSAGRVQSVTVRFVAEREREIENFKSGKYFKITALFKKQGEKETVEFELVEVKGKKLEYFETYDLFAGPYKCRTSHFKTESQAQKLVQKITNLKFRVLNVEEKEIKRNPLPPFTTSTLAQTSGRFLGFSTKRTMRLAQNLYEKGLITYHRTDSTALSAQFTAAAKDFIEKKFGKDYALLKPRIYKTKQRLAQEAHEAIRPTDIKQQTAEMLGEAQARLYKLIWRRATACQMSAAVLKTSKIKVGTQAKNYLFSASGLVVKFPGFLKVWQEGLKERKLPQFVPNEPLDMVKLIPTKHFTQPPPRYSEASLVAILEKKGIGRPSTYAPTLSTVQERQYLIKEEGKFKPTKLGLVVNDFLVKHFGGIVNIPFTARMEDDLDEIANGRKKWRPVIAEFYQPFAEKLEKVAAKAKRVKVEEKLKEKCPECGASLVIKFGRYGKFISCSKFPKCDFKKNYIEKIGQKCPECGGEIIVRKTRKGRVFYGCSNYPKCNWASWQKPKFV